jgi:hypothetical protein
LNFFPPNRESKSLPATRRCRCRCRCRCHVIMMSDVRQSTMMFNVQWRSVSVIMLHRLRPKQFLPLLLVLQLLVLAVAEAGGTSQSLTLLFVPSCWERRQVDVACVHRRRHDDGPRIIPQVQHLRHIHLPQLQQKQHRSNHYTNRRLLFLSSSQFEYESTSLLSPSDTWGNIATLAFSASLAQLLGKSTTIGKLLGAPVTAMALTFALSSIGWIPTRIITSSSSSSMMSSSIWKWKTLLPPGGSPTSSFLQGISLTLATPLLLLGGTSGLRRRKQPRGGEQEQGKDEVERQDEGAMSTSSSLGPLLASFTIASLGTLLGSILAISLPQVRNTLQSSLGGGIGGNNDGIIIAAALLAKNIGGGINYMAVCACLGASAESIAAGLCVDNVMALVYFPYVSYLASRYEDVADAAEDNTELDNAEEVVEVDEVSSRSSSTSTTSIEALSHAFTLAAVLTSLGQYLNSKLHHITQLLRDSNTGSTSSSSPLNLSLPITTLLTVVFSMYYPPNIFLSPTTTTTSSTKHSQIRRDGEIRNNSIAQAGETLGTSLLYLFFATAGAPGWRLQDSIRQSFPSIASFLTILYGVHGIVLWGSRKLIGVLAAASPAKADNGEKNDEYNHNKKLFWRMAVAPQRLLVASSAAIGGPATAAALAKSVRWESLVTPGLLVGNIGYAVATFIGLLFYSVYR